MNEKKNIFTNSEDKWDFIIALIVIVVFSVFIFQFFFKTEEKAIVDTTISNKENQFLYVNSNKYQAKTIKTEDAYEEIEIDSAIVVSDEIKNETIVIDSISKITNTDIKTVIPSNKQLELDTKIEVNDSIIPSFSNTQTETDRQAETIDSLSLSLPNSQLKPDAKIEVVDSITSARSNTQLKIKDTTITTPKPTTKIEEEEEEEEEDKLQKTTSIKLEQEEKKTEQNKAIKTPNCVIVVGVFKEISNKTAIVDKLISLGYTHSEGTLRKGLNYVGVPVDCNDKQKKKDLLSELNQAFGIQSWVKKI